MTEPQPKLGDRSLWSTLSCAAYLNHAAIAPLSDPARSAMERVALDFAKRGSLAFAERAAEREQLRAGLALLLGAEPREIALVPNTMYGLASIALSMPWRAGERVLAFHGEYPTNVTVYQRAAELFGLSLTLLPTADFLAPGGADLGRLEQELRKGGVRLCAVSAVEFQTGVRAPLAEIAALCHAHGAELVVDAIQAAGVVPLDVRALGVDFLVGGSHKFLMGGDGLGVLYAAAEHMQKLRPAITGAMSYVGAMDMLLAGPGHLRYDRTLRDDARVFEGGTLSSASAAALHASLSLLLQLTVPAIHRHVNDYLDALEPVFTAQGFRSLRAPDLARRSATLSFTPPPGHTAPKLAAALAEQGVVVACPDGVLRLSPHWPNHRAEVPKVADALGRALVAAQG